MREDGPYLRWARGCGRPGLANRPIGPVGPYFIIYTIYPLQFLFYGKKGGDEKRSLDRTNCPKKDTPSQLVGMKA